MRCCDTFSRNWFSYMEQAFFLIHFWYNVPPNIVLKYYKSVLIELKYRIGVLGYM